MPSAGPYWAPRAQEKLDAELGPNMRMDGITKSMDFSYGATLNGIHDTLFDEMAEAFQKVVPRGLWHFAEEHPYGGVTIREIDGIPMSLTSMEFCYFVSRLIPVLTPGARFLEIGGGFGGMARALYLLDPSIRLTTIDFEPMLRIQEHYLQETSALGDFCFATEIPDGEYLVAINTRSFCEMAIEEVNEYFRRLDQVLPPGGVFYSMNHNVCQNRYADWIVPNTWEFIDERRYPLPWKKGEQFTWWERTWRKPYNDAA